MATSIDASSTKAAAPVADKKSVEGCGKAPVAESLQLAAALIALGGIYWAHRLSKRREFIARFATAAKDFRAAFADELAFLQSGVEVYEGVDVYLTKAYHAKHGAAFIAFEQFVRPDDRLDGLREAWHQYHSGHEDYAEEEGGIVPGGGAPLQGSLFSEYSWHWVGREEYPDALAVKRMKALLEFARNA